MVKVGLDLYFLQIKSFRKFNAIRQMSAEIVLTDSADHRQTNARVTHRQTDLVIQLSCV